MGARHRRPRIGRDVKRWARLGSPLAASIALRISQLLVMIAAAQTFPAALRPSVLAAFGVIAAVAVFSDAGAATYLLTRANLTRATLAGALRVQALIGVIGIVAGVSYASLALPWPPGPLRVAIVGAIAVSQALDAQTRVARSASLHRGADARYALGDALLALTKSTVAVGMIAAALPLLLLVLPLLSAVVLVSVIAVARASLPQGEDAVRFGDVIDYGLSGAASGLYSQAPFMLAVALAPVEAVAALAVALRVIQPLEVVPAVVSQQMIPRVRTRDLTATRPWVGFAAVGLVCGVVVVLCGPLIEWLFRQPLSPTGLLVLLAATLPFKFGNYALAAFLLALGGVRRKTMLSLAVGVATAVGGVAVIEAVGVLGAPISMIFAEAALALGLAHGVVRQRQAGGPP